ncbi:MAG: DNA-binding response regulator [Candidatus Tectimicrobiota bacterium]|nr:MAG: DNA-binding response regulator [Candidatus Tectomicrobia bacterium]
MRLLVVEDDKKLASFLKRGLEEEHYAVDVAHDGEEGWYLSQVNDYDLLVLDIMLPKLDGLALCRKLRQQRQDTPILLLTARDAVADRVTGLDLGADDYLVKPFAFAELLARIRALLRRRRGPLAMPLQVADLVLDPVAHRVTRGGQPIELTAKEYALLEFLMRHAGEVVTRTQIAEHVWDQHFDSDSNVIDVYISYLRQKIDRPFATRLLHTVRGVGYVLREEA